MKITKIVEQVTAEPAENKQSLAECLTELHNNYKSKLVEDTNSSIVAVKDRVRDYIKTELDELFDNLAISIHSDIRDYNPDWCSEDGKGVPASRIQRAMLNLVDAAIMVLFENAKVNESVYDMDKRCEKCNTLLNDAGTCPKCDDGEEDYEDRDEDFVLREEFYDEEDILRNHGYRQDNLKDTFEIGDRVAQRWADEYNVGTIKDTREHEGVQYQVEWDYSEGEQVEWLYADEITHWVDVHEAAQLHEDILEEGPISAMKNAFNKIRDRVNPEGAVKRALDKVQKEDEKYKDPKKAYPVLAKDFDPASKNYIFIPAGTKKKLNYDQWLAAYRDVASDPSVDPERYAEWFNAIVVKPNGYMIRRGAQDMTKEHVMLNATTSKVLDKYKLEPAKIVADDRADAPVEIHTPSEEPTAPSTEPATSTAEPSAKPTASSAEADATAEETPAAPASDVKAKMLDKFVNIALATGLVVTNSRNQRLSKRQTLKKITPETTDNYTVHVTGKDPVKLSAWLNQAKKAGLLESTENSELETALLVEDVSSPYYFRTGDMFIDGLVNNMDEDEIDKNVAELESIAVKLNVSVSDVVIFNDTESVYDPAYYEGAGLRYDTTVGVIKYYRLDNVLFGHTYFHGADWFYFASESEAESILNKLNTYGE